MDLRITSAQTGKGEKRETKRSTRSSRFVNRRADPAARWQEGTRRRGGFAEFAALSAAADFWCECVMGHTQPRWRTVTSTWTIDVSHQLQFARGEREGEGGRNSSYTRDNCYWQIVMPVISHGGDRMDARSAARARFHVSLPSPPLTKRVCGRTKTRLLLERTRCLIIHLDTWIKCQDDVQVGWKIQRDG